MNTTGNSSPFAACRVMSWMPASSAPSASSVSDSSDSSSTKPVSDASGSRTS